MQNKKRERTVNFTVDETRLLVNIVLKYMHVIENKKTDAVTWKMKNDIWEKITAEFNSQSGKVHRTSKVLRLKYDVLKRQVKKKQCDIKIEMYKTGGGSFVETPLTDFEAKLTQILSLSINGLPSRSDSDIQETNLDTTSQEETIILEYVVDQSSGLCQSSESENPKCKADEVEAPRETGYSESERQITFGEHSQPTPSTSRDVVDEIVEEDCTVTKTKVNDEKAMETLRKNFKNTPGKKKDILFKQYGNIAENRNVLLDLQKQHFQEENDRQQREHEYRMENLQFQRQYMMNEEARKLEEHRMYIKKLKLEIDMLKQNDFDKEYQ